MIINLVNFPTCQKLVGLRCFCLVQSSRNYMIDWPLNKTLNSRHDWLFAVHGLLHVARVRLPAGHNSTAHFNAHFTILYEKEKSVKWFILMKFTEIPEWAQNTLHLNSC